MDSKYSLISKGLIKVTNFIASIFLQMLPPGNLLVYDLRINSCPFDLEGIWCTFEFKLAFNLLLPLQTSLPKQHSQMGPGQAQPGPNRGPTGAQPGPNRGPTGAQLGPTGAQPGPTWNAARVSSKLCTRPLTQSVTPLTLSIPTADYWIRPWPGPWVQCTGDHGWGRLGG